MFKRFSTFFLIIIQFSLYSGIAKAQSHVDIIVDQSGKGNFTTLSAAIQSLSMYSYRRVVILLRNGIYNEHVRISQNYVTLRGENRDNTIIQFDLSRLDWEENKDNIGPGVVNIFADDVILENLTIENSQPKTGPHAFAVYGKGTRIIILNCNIYSKGADTVALWNYKDGMYYHSGCKFRGAVDFVCPRGWCFVRDSEFYEVKKTAAIWHDGHYDPQQKFVLKNCSFDGVPGFKLGRHHYQAQFYLIDCKFSENMADQPIYIHTYENEQKNNPDILGERNYFYGSLKQGKSFSWLENNLHTADNISDAEKITASWTFDDKWNPENDKPIKIIKWNIQQDRVILYFNELVSVRGNPVLKRADGLKLKTKIYRFNDVNSLIFDIEGETENQISGQYQITNGQILASHAFIRERQLVSPVFIP